MRFLSAPADTVAALRDLLHEPRTIAIVTHFNPDGDAMGSSLGLAAILTKLGHRVRVVLPNTPAPNLRWMPGSADAIAFDQDREASERTLRESDVVFCLDFNKQDRVGGLEAALRDAPVKVLIDHHRHPDAFAQVSFSDISASSTAQMVFDIIGGLGHLDLIDHEVAACLFAGIMTDSGSFRFSSTSPHTLEVAAELMRRGAVPDAIHGAIMDDNTEHRLKLLGFALSERMTVYPEWATAVIVLSKEDLNRFHYQPGDTEGLVNYGLGIRGVRMAAFIAERPDVVKLSLRSKGDLPVNEFLARHFNGGGHGNAAGGHAHEPLAQVMERFKRELPAFLAAHPA